MQKLVAGGGSQGASFQVTPASAKEEEETTKTREYKAKDFVVNFLQKKAPTEEEAEALNSALGEMGLAKVWKKEHKQRAVIFAIVNTAANNAMGFTDFYNMVKMAKVYSKNYVPGNGMPASNLDGSLDSFKGILSPTEAVKLHKLADLLSGRACNFKEMMDLLNADAIMGKFKSPAIEQDGISMEDLEAGLNQMGFPMLRIIAKNYKGATDPQGHQL